MENVNFSPKIYIFTHEMLNASIEKSDFNRSPGLGFICMIRYVRCPILLPQNSISKKYIISLKIADFDLQYF